MKKEGDGFMKACLVGSLLLLISIIPGCSSSSIEPSLDEIESAKKLTNYELMAVYGAALRLDYQTQEDSITGNDLLLEVEQEAEARNLVNKKNFGEIEQGLVYMDMPIHQMFASIDGLDIEEHADFENFVLSLYRGNLRNKSLRPGDIFRYALVPLIIPSVVKQRTGDKNRETVLVCKNKLGGEPKIIGYKVWGTYTFEKYKMKSGHDHKIITNYSPDHFEPRSPESLKYIKSGRQPPRKPQKMLKDAAGGWRWILLEITNGSGSAGSRLNTLFDDAAASGNYASILRYLEKVC